MIGSLSLVARTYQVAGTNQQTTANPRQVITGSSSRLPTSDVELLRLHYDAGARTYWHTHAGRQLMLVEEGEGRFQERGGKIVELEAGQTYYAKPNVPHWHGASPNAAATLLQVYPHGVKITIMEPVTEDEYRGKTPTFRQ